MLKKSLFLIFGLLISPFLVNGENEKRSAMDLTAEEFLSVVRNPPGRESWALMVGKAVHKRDGSRTVEAPLRMGIQFTPARTIAQVLFDGDEIYEVAQSYNPPVSSFDSTLPEGKKPRLGIFGISASDLTMNFLYQPLIAEHKSESIKRQTCRVFSLKASDGKGWNKVYISTEYFFPLKMEYFSAESADIKESERKPVRTLEISGFTKENDFWVVKTLKLSGSESEWRTIIEFDKVSAGFSADGIPADLFAEP